MHVMSDVMGEEGTVKKQNGIANDNEFCCGRKENIKRKAFSIYS